MLITIGTCNLVLLNPQSFFSSLIQERESQRHAAATIIQKNWRRHVEVTKLASLKLAVVTLQSFARATICRRRFMTLKRVVVAVQSRVRRNIAVSKYRQIRDDVIKIQSVARRWEPFSLNQHLAPEEALCIVTMCLIVGRFMELIILKAWNTAF